MKKTSRFKCDCGEMLEVPAKADIVKCRVCGKPWLKRQWEQRLSPSDGLLIPQEQPVAPIEIDSLARKKPLPATTMFDQEDILAVKEASIKKEETEGESEKKKLKRPLPATQMFTTEEIEDVKKASSEGSQPLKGAAKK